MAAIEQDIQNVFKAWRAETKDSQGASLDKNLQAFIQSNSDADKLQQRMQAMWFDLLEELKKDYYERFADEKPSETPLLHAFLTGKFHTVIANSLHTPEAYAQGFFGCLLGATAAGTGAILGEFVKLAIWYFRLFDVITKAVVLD